MRRLAGTIAIVVIAVAGVIGIIAFFDSRDRSTTAAPQGAQSQRPGAPAPAAERDPTWRPLAAKLRLGNVGLRFGNRSDEAALRRMAAGVGATFGSSGPLEQAGQALLPVYAPDQKGITARAYERVLNVASPADPRLQDFVGAWLGRPGPG